MSIETLPVTDSVERCRDILATAAALGMQVKAIPGSIAYEAHVADGSEDYDWSLGIFPDLASAQRALAQWVIRELVESGDEPWLRESRGSVNDEGDALLDEWLQTKTPAQVIEYYEQRSSDALAINEMVISGPLPGTNTSLTASEIFAHIA